MPSTPTHAPPKRLSIAQLLALPHLAIPSYQRPYKWTPKHVAQLFEDLERFQHKGAYRLGSVVLHRHASHAKPVLDLVDGQQRTLTLALTVWALAQERAAKLKHPTLRQQLQSLQRHALEPFMARQTFASPITHHNLRENLGHIKRVVLSEGFSEAHIDFLLNRCEVVCFELSDVSEAFQLFDSQNARGRDLAPHDLLKAFHLREFPDHEKHLQAQAVAHWEHLDSKDLSALFGNYLFRIRQWSRCESARQFGKDDVGLFKGISLHAQAAPPFAQAQRIVHHHVDAYNRHHHRHIDQQVARYPFQLDQVVLNGRRFFEMAEHCERQLKHVQETLPKQLGHEGQLSWQIIDTLNSYPQRHRIGDQYVRMLFDCALTFYVDKFGDDKLPTAIENIFIWAYRCRIQHRRLSLASADKHVLEDNLFQRLCHAIRPQDAWRPLPALQATDNKNNLSDPNAASQDPLVQLFKALQAHA